MMFGDRKDGKREKMNGFDRFLYYLKPKRSEAEVYISKKIDVTNLVRYMERKKKDNENLTYFQMFMVSIAKLIYNRPKLNKFIIGGNKYMRNEVALSFVAKTKIDDESKELMAVVRADKSDNLDSLSKKIYDCVKKIRSNKESQADGVVKWLGKLPKVIMAFIVWMIKRLDNLDLLPRSLTKDSIYHSSVLVSNLGSIHCGGIYHNITNFGTNSIVVTIGEIKEEAVVKDGKVVSRYMCEFGITLDERIADGVYYAKCVNLLEYILDNPELLEDRVDAKIVNDKG